MKSMILIASLFIGSVSFANGEKIVCREKSGEKQITVVVRTGKSLPVKTEESVEARFEADIEVYGKSSLMPQISEVGVVETEDVLYNFTSSNKKITLHIYLDEIDQSLIIVNGKEIGLICF